MSRRRTRRTAPAAAEPARQPPVAAAPPAAAPAATAQAPDGLFALARRTGVQALAAALLLGFFAANAVVVARSDTPTPDEFVYVPAGLYHLQTGDLSFDSTNPPLLKMLMALPLATMDLKIDRDPRSRDNRTGWGPWIFGTSFMNLNRERYLDAYFAARLVVVAIAVGLGVLLFLRARELMSAPAALAVLALYSTMSPVVAHSALATLDVGVSALIFAALLAAARFAGTRAWGWAAATGALFGLAFAVKGTAALMAPLVPVLVAAGWKDWRQESAMRFVGGGAAMAVAAWLAILAAYGFQDFPLPAPLVEGVRFQLAASSAGEFPAFLGGSWSQTGWWYYYLYALMLKTPLPSLLLMVAGVAALVRSRRATGMDDLWILLPSLLLLYVLSFHYAKDYGVRYLLPAFPFLLLLAGRGVDLLLAAGRRGRIAVAVLLLWQAASFAMAAPHHLAWFNELAGGGDRARRLLLDSNLDWGQDLGRLKDYLDARGNPRIGLGYFGHVDPAVYGIAYDLAPTTPTAGLFAISANFLGGYPYAITYGDRMRPVKAGMWTWLDRLEPAARIGRSIYVFDVSEADVARLGAAPRPGGRP
ncbi:MAG: glycosyltransferase family 39 protein [Candidatus Binatia bacterium]